MPKILSPCPGVRQSFTRPVVLDVTRQLLILTGLPENTPIQFPDEHETQYQQGTTIQPPKDTVDFGTGTKLKVSTQETPIKEEVLTQAIYYPDAPIIFADEALRVWLRPVFRPTQITINVSFRATDHAAAEAWRNDIRSHVGMLREVYLHDATYHYLIDRDVIARLKRIHEMREKVAPYGQTWEEYYTEKFVSRMHLVTTMIGTESEFSIAETQERVQGVFEIEDAPEEGSKEADSAAWTVSFSYQFRVAKPVQTVLEYPVMVHNQPIPEDMRVMQPAPDDGKYKRGFTLSSGALHQFEMNAKIDYRGRLGVTIPSFDEFVPSQVSIMPETVRVFTALMVIDETDPTLLMDFTQSLGRNYEFDADVRELVLSEAPWLTKQRHSIFNVGVYCNDYLMEPGSYFVDANKQLRLTEDADLRSQYHVRFSLDERPRFLLDEAKLRLRNNCKATQKVLLSLDPTLYERGLLPVCMVGNYMPAQTFNDAVNDIDRRFDPNFNGMIYQWNTVMTLYAVANRR